MIFASLPKCIIRAVPSASFDVSNCPLKRRTYITECKRTNKDPSFLASSVLSLPAISEFHDCPYTVKSPRPNCHLIHKSVPLANSARRERIFIHATLSLLLRPGHACTPENQMVGYQSWFNLIFVAKHHKVRGWLTAITVRVLAFRMLFSDCEV